MILQEAIYSFLPETLRTRLLGTDDPAFIVQRIETVKETGKFFLYVYFRHVEDSNYWKYHHILRVDWDSVEEAVLELNLLFDNPRIATLPERYVPSNIPRFIHRTGPASYESIYRDFRKIWGVWE